MTLRICCVPGCPAFIEAGTRDGRCSGCRLTTSQRDYGTEHQQLRRQWAPKVAAGLVDCSRCDAPIRPGQPWHLDHTDDRTGYLGPSHALCDSTAGGRAAAQR